MKQWYAEHFLSFKSTSTSTTTISAKSSSPHAHDGDGIKNINTMAALYGLACLLELSEDQGGYAAEGEERNELIKEAGEWGDWMMDVLPSECEEIETSGPATL